MIKSIQVRNGGLAVINTIYHAQNPATIPVGFAKTCNEMNWDSSTMWKQLSDDRKWFLAENESYIYFNTSDGRWWIDEPSGKGAYVSKADTELPPKEGWMALGGIPLPVPEVEVIVVTAGRLLEK